MNANPSLVWEQWRIIVSTESNVVVEWLKLLLRILEVPGKNLGPETGYRD
jgi:hypothetical protein